MDPKPQKILCTVSKTFTYTTVFGKNLFSFGLATPLLSLSFLSGIAFYNADSQQ
jgi:hypothetical protein